MVADHAADPRRIRRERSRRTLTTAASRSTVRAGLAWAGLGVLVFSFSLPATKIALGGFGPWTISFGRAAVAGLLAAVLLRVARVPWPGRHLLRPLLITALGAVVGWPVLLGFALERTTSAHAAVVTAVMPIATAVIAVTRTHERGSRQFWAAAGVGAVAVLVFTALRGGLEGAEPIADLLLLAAVLASASCYVEGAILTRVMPGWQVISWVLVVSLPLTLPGTIACWWWLDAATLPSSSGPWLGMAYLSVMSMYLGFFAWYRGLAEAGVVRGSQMQLLQAPLTLGWSALLLAEVVTPLMGLTILVILACVAWTQRARIPTASR